MPRSRPWLAALSVVAFLFGLTTGPLLNDARAQDEPIELRVWDPFTEGSASPTIEAVYATFMEENPNITTRPPNVPTVASTSAAFPASASAPDK